MGKFHTSKKILTLPAATAADGIYQFEEIADIIFSEIEKYRSRWTLTVVTIIDFDDVKNIIASVIYKKFYQWDQTRSIFPWLHTAIRNLIKNFWRDKYWSFQKPCVRCAAFDSFTESCTVYGEPCEKCPLYKKWVDTSKNDACNVKLPISIFDERVVNKISSISDDSYDLEKAVNNFHERMKGVLTKQQFKIYRLFYIEGKNENEVAKEMGYKTTNHNEEKKRIPGYRWIAMVVVEINKKAKEVIEKFGVE